jgi:hypothetical protein
MPEKDTGLIAEALKWVWLGLLALGSYVWNCLSGDVRRNEENLILFKKDLSDHIVDDLKSHEDFVSHAYVESEIKPWMRDINGKMDLIIQQTADVIKRDEYKKDIGTLYSSIANLNADISGLKGKLDK